MSSNETDQARSAPLSPGALFDSTLHVYDVAITAFLQQHPADDTNTAVYAKVLLERIRNDARNVLGELTERRSVMSYEDRLRAGGWLLCHGTGS